MPYRGHMENGVVVLDEPALLPEGAPVLVDLPGQTTAEPNDGQVLTDYERLEALIGKAEGLPPDLALNHDHYLHGQLEEMTALFADTFYYLALLSRDDMAHDWATSLARTITAPKITTAWVMTEIADALARPTQRGLFTALLRSLKSDTSVTIIPASQELFDRGVELYNARPDKGWSLTDCISFVVMSQYGVTDSLTGDQHFEQAGFKALLK